MRARRTRAHLYQCTSTVRRCQAVAERGGRVLVSTADAARTARRALAVLSRRSATAGGRPYLVGGAVRDALLGLPLEDWDVEVFGLAAEALEPLLAAHGRVDAVGQAFRVYKLSGVEGVPGAIDVSLPRRDSKVGPGHRGIAVSGRSPPVGRGSRAAARFHDQRDAVRPGHGRARRPVGRPGRPRGARPASGGPGHLRRRPAAGAARGAARRPLRAAGGRGDRRALRARCRSPSCRPSASSARSRSCC